VTFLQIAGHLAAPNQFDAWSSNANLTVQSYVNLSFNPGANSSNWGSGVSLICPTAGYYTFVFTLDTPSVSTNRQVVFQMLRNGGAVIDTGTVEVGDYGNKGHLGMQYYGVWNPGDQLIIRGQSWQGQTITVGPGHLVITFVPTPSFRR
jgi:hypothetical protein